MRKLVSSLLLATASTALAQTSASAVPDVTNSPAAQAVLSLDHWRETRVATYMNDFGELSHYAKANAELPAPATGENRVIFFGDSITDEWNLDT
ncbi:MAG TPA: hypothetical protein VHT24_11555 [Pseudacidobacterium sp.]|jgi:hypothetical protein|nr:hypothetical protein [Pseudacidobacterium sp.]